MKILLVNATEFSFKTYPLGLLYIAAVLEHRGHTVKLYDEQYEQSFSFAGFDMVGISCMTTRTNEVLNLRDEIREKDLDIPIVFGGAHATILPETLVKYPNEFAIIGEGEDTIVDLVDYLSIPTQSLPDGIVYREHQTLCRTKPRRPIENLDKIPYPARHLLHERYLKSHRDNMICSRGCPFDCSFCQPTLRLIFGNKVRYRSPEDIRGEVSLIQAMLDVRLIIFHDDTMTVNKKWLMQVCDKLKETGVEWECQGRVNTIDRELVGKMKQAGCRAIRFGVESGCQDILDSLNKGITVEQTRRAFKICNDVGMDTQAHIMVGNPTESIGSIRATETLIKEIKPTRLYVTITTPMPKTHLWEDMGLSGKLIDWKDYNPSGQSSMIELDNFTSDAIVDIRNRIMRKFWLRRLLSPRFVWKTIRTHSLSESFGTFKHLLGGN